MWFSLSNLNDIYVIKKMGFDLGGFIWGIVEDFDKGVYGGFSIVRI